MLSLIPFTGGCCGGLTKKTVEKHNAKFIAFDFLAFITTLVIGILAVMGIIPNVSSAAGFGIIAVPIAITLLYIPIIFCGIKHICCNPNKPNWANHPSVVEFRNELTEATLN